MRKVDLNRLNRVRVWRRPSTTPTTRTRPAIHTWPTLHTSSMPLRYGRIILVSVELFVADFVCDVGLVLDELVVHM